MALATTTPNTALTVKVMGIANSIGTVGALGRLEKRVQSEMRMEAPVYEPATPQAPDMIEKPVSTGDNLMSGLTRLPADP